MKNVFFNNFIICSCFLHFLFLQVILSFFLFSLNYPFIISSLSSPFFSILSLFYSSIFILLFFPLFTLLQPAYTCYLQPNQTTSNPFWFKALFFPECLTFGTDMRMMIVISEEGKVSYLTMILETPTSYDNHLHEANNWIL